MYIYIMLRTQIYLSASIDSALTRQSKKTGLSKSQLIRSALEKVYLGSREKQAALQALRDSAGTWRRNEDGQAHVEKIRPGNLARRLAQR
jgi:hypothetical protein